jgi:hypothetical protein
MMTPRIFYFASDDPTPAGGEIDTYDHVDALNAAGLDAYALHITPGYRHTWFDNDTKVIDTKRFWSLYDQARDYIVVHESIGPRIAMFPGKKVIFNKNLYHGFSVFGLNPEATYPYLDDTVAAVLVTSEHNMRHLQFAFKDARMFRMYTRIDGERFAYRPIAQKRRRICAVAKAIPDLSVLAHLLWVRARGGQNRLAGYDWVFLRGLSQAQVAEALADALIVVNLSTHEGLPRTVLEAMSCGCLVVSYGSGTMQECLPAQSAFESDDFVRLATEIERIAEQFETSPERLVRWAEEGQAIAARFTRERQRAAVMAAWESILSAVPS